MQDSKAVRTAILLATIGLIALVFAVFYPLLGYDFVNLDVGQHLVENPHIRGLSLENLKHIFTSLCTTSYYPVRSLTLALDYQLWGLNPAGFKLTNILIHVANVLLVFWLVLRLFPRPTAADTSFRAWQDVSVAAFSAGLFAVHPVVVEPVAWVPGREELLMTLGALGCIHFHVRARRLSENGAETRWVAASHGAAALSCAAACMSNAVAAVIPLLIVAWDVLMLVRPTLWRILGGTAALWAIGLATIAVKKIGEFTDSPYEVEAFSSERVALALNAFWLNLKTVAWPTDLAVFHPRVKPAGFGDVEVILGGIAICLTCALLWTIRRRKLILFGLVWAAIALGPASQIMVHHIHRADRFLYLPLVGLVVAVAIGLRPLGSVLKGRAAVATIMVTGVLGLLLLGKLSAVQVLTWKDAASMWENCVRVDPDNDGFRCAFSDRLVRRGQFSLAIEQLEKVLQLYPDHGKAAAKLAWLLVSCEDPVLRDPDRALRLTERAFENDPLFFRALGRVRCRVAETMAEEEQFDRAIAGYESAFQVDPGNQQALLELSLLLATCGDEKLRDPGRAVELAERACLLKKQPGPEELSVLGMAYAQAGKLETAIRTAEKAVELARAGDDAKLLDELRGQLRGYKERLQDREVR